LDAGFLICKGRQKAGNFPFHLTFFAARNSWSHCREVVEQDKRPETAITGSGCAREVAANAAQFLEKGGDPGAESS